MAESSKKTEKYIPNPFEAAALKELHQCWKGKDRKITDEEIKCFMPIKGRTNQESRDAALLAWVFSGLPIRVKPVKC